MAPVRLAALALLAASAHAAYTDAAMLSGLTEPVFVSFDGAGHTLVAEKAGKVKLFTGLFGNTGDVLLDITGAVASYGDHGLMGALPYAGYLWLTYSRQTPGIGNACTDSGQIDGRPYDQIYGCMLFGRVSRFPYDAATATITGPEDIVMDGENNDKQGCSQFSTHGITGLVVGADNFIYFSFGEGASFQAPDNGEFGNNPCNDRPGYTGAYRAMDPERYAGKIVRVDPVTAELVIVTSGHRNPFRLTVWNGQLYESETGWFTYEEVNLINTDVTVPFLNKQYGWPCYEGPVLQQIYSGQNMPPCVALQAAGNAVMPWFYYEDPGVPQPNGNHGSISALGGWGDRMYIGDFTQRLIWSVNVQAQDLQLVMTEVNVVGLFPSAAGLLVIDYYAGTIAPLETGGVAGAAPVAAPPPPPAPFVGVVPQQATWQPGGGPLTYGITTNVAGREGANTEWSVSLLTGCSDAGACQVAQLVAPAGPAPNVLTIPSPPIAGTLEFWVRVWTFGGLSVQSTWWQASAGAAECQCAGQRTPVTAASIGWGGAPPVEDAADAPGAVVDPVPVPAPAPPAGAVGAPAIILSVFPAAGTLGVVAGRVAGLPAAAAGYKIALYAGVAAAAQGNLWIKPFAVPPSSTPLGADGSFSIAAWASSPQTDITWTDITLVVLPTAAAVFAASGTPLDAATAAAALVITNFPRGYAPPPPAVAAGGGGGGGGGPAQGTITIRTFPAVGETTAIRGVVAGLPAGGLFVAVLALEKPAGEFWVKPLPGAFAPVAADGAFSFDWWASAPASDVGFVSLRVLILSVASLPLPPLAGVPLPASLVGAAWAVSTIAPGFVVAPPAVPAGSLTLTAVPAAGTTTALAGVLSGVAAPGSYVIVVYLVTAGGTVYIKPVPGASTAVAADGAWAVPAWASNTADAAFSSLVVVALVAGTPVLSAAGAAPLPAYQPAALAASVRVDAGYAAAVGAAIAVPAAAGGYAAGITLSAFPAPGALTPIAGVITGLATPATHCVLLYVLDGAGVNWWTKPVPNACAPCAASGAWSVNWASNALADTAVAGFQIYVVLASAPRIVVLGGPLPSAADVGAVAALHVGRGYVVQAASTTNDSSSTSTGGGSTGASSSGATAPALAQALTGSLIAVSTVLGALLVAGLAVGGYAAWLKRRDDADDAVAVVRRSSTLAAPSPMPPPPPAQAAAALPPRHPPAPINVDGDAPAGAGIAAANAAAATNNGRKRKNKRHPHGGREAWDSPHATPSAAAVAVTSPPHA